MFYTVYKTTNKINNKFYIGMHQTKNLNDEYLGSGKRLKKAIEKHGLENFTKQILFIFDNEEDMKNKEKELVLLSEMSYNLCEGGKGGFGYLNRTRLNTTGVKNRNYKEISKKASNTRKLNNFSHSEETKQKISASSKLNKETRSKNISNAVKGKPKSLEHRLKISQSVKKTLEEKRKHL